MNSGARRFRHPEGVAVDHDGYVYVADTGNHAIRVITPRGHVITLAGTGSPGNKDGFATEGAQLSSPTDIAVWRDWAWWPYANPIDPDSLLYKPGDGRVTLFVADTANHRIRKISGDVDIDPDSGEKFWSNVKMECFSGWCNKKPEPGFADGKGIKIRLSVRNRC
jgi:sugar lactone lactonase YvrE